MREPLWPRPDAARTMEIVMRFALLAALVMACVSTGAQAQSLACDAFAKNADGSWTENEITGTGFPKVFYLKYDMYRNAWPLHATRWRAMVGGRSLVISLDMVGSRYLFPSNARITGSSRKVSDVQFG